jgi:hypothetical protein
VHALTFHWLCCRVDATTRYRVCTVGVRMPQYFFTVRADSADAQESAADLRDDAAAFAFALDLIQAARAGTLGGSLVKVRDATRPIVFSIPFLPASA